MTATTPLSPDKNKNTLVLRLDLKPLRRKTNTNAAPSEEKTATQILPRPHVSTVRTWKGLAKRPNHESREATRNDRLGTGTKT